MKKVISFVLIAMMIFGLLACGASGEQTGGENAGIQLKDGQLLVGYAKVDITPEDSVPLRGFGNTEKRMSTGFQSPIFATCVVLTDKSGNSSVIIGYDLTGTGDGVFDTLQKSISETYGIPVTNILQCASHMHSGPDFGSSVLSMQRYTPLFAQMVKDMVAEAWADRSPADIYVATAKTEGLNFVRTYIIEAPDGTQMYAGYQSDITETGYPVVGYESEADRDLGLLKFDREEGKRDVLIANFQTHPHRGDGMSNTLINANIPGAFRDEIEKKLGYYCVYIIGASGNINPDTPKKEDNITANYTEQGKALAQYAIQAEGSYEKVNGYDIQSQTRTFEGKINHADEHLMAVALEAQVVWQSTSSVAAVRKEFLDDGIHSPYHANAIISRAKMGETSSFDIWAISLGDVGIAVAPYEMYDTNGMFIKENSPKKMTIVSTCSNGGNGYFPSKLAFQHPGYEVDTTRYAEGSAEALADLYVEMLTEMSK